MSKVREKIKLTSYDELLKVEITDGLKEIDVDKLHDFSNHPFKVSDDEKMEELTESIRERGVLLPILVRKTNDEEYEIISGHRRTHAARLALSFLTVVFVVFCFLIVTVFLFFLNFLLVAT